MGFSVPPFLDHFVFRSWLTLDFSFTLLVPRGEFFVPCTAKSPFLGNLSFPFLVDLQFEFCVPRSLYSLIQGLIVLPVVVHLNTLTPALAGHMISSF